MAVSGWQRGGGEESDSGTGSWPLGLLNEGVGSGSEAAGGGNGVPGSSFSPSEPPCR